MNCSTIPKPIIQWQEKGFEQICPMDALSTSLPAVSCSTEETGGKPQCADVFMAFILCETDWPDVVVIAAWN